MELEGERMKFICKGCDPPCIITFEEERKISAPRRCPWTAYAGCEWELMKEGDECQKN